MNCWTFGLLVLHLLLLFVLWLLICVVPFLVCCDLFLRYIVRCWILRLWCLLYCYLLYCMCGAVLLFCCRWYYLLLLAYYLLLYLFIVLLLCVFWHCCSVVIVDYSSVPYLVFLCGRCVLLYPITDSRLYTLCTISVFSTDIDSDCCYSYVYTIYSSVLVAMIYCIQIVTMWCDCYVLMMVVHIIYCNYCCYCGVLYCMYIIVLVVEVVHCCSWITFLWPSYYSLEVNVIEFLNCSLFLPYVIPWTTYYRSSEFLYVIVWFLYTDYYLNYVPSMEEWCM